MSATVELLDSLELDLVESDFELSLALDCVDELDWLLVELPDEPELELCVLSELVDRSTMLELPLLELSELELVPKLEFELVLRLETD